MSTRSGDRTSKEWYEEGQRLLEKKRYNGAIEAFNEAATLYRDASLDADIQLALGGAYFRNKDYEAAIETYREFLRLHPRNRHSDTAQFQIGKAYFQQMRGPDRSQEATRMAMAAFEKVIRNYPRSEYAGDAREKIVVCRRRLAEHELDVGRYYMRTKSFSAALPRFDSLYHDYGDLGYGDDALFYLGLCYLSLKNEKKAQEVWERLLEDFPHSSYLKKVRKRMKKMGRS
jgi:outer membrane protein assembly factor BamD